MILFAGQDREPVTTSGTIAAVNLSARIDSLAGSPRAAELIDLLTLRGHVLGRIADYERAAELAEQLVRDATDDGKALLARARTRATFHRFADALADLDAAQQRGRAVPRWRRSGRRSCRRSDAMRKPWNCIAMPRSDGPVSPRWERWPPCTLSSGKWPRQSACSPRRSAGTGVPRRFCPPRSTSGAASCGTARATCRRPVPGSRPASAGCRRTLPRWAASRILTRPWGAYEAAIRRLRSLASTSDDPGYAARLARALGAAGHRREAEQWRLSAAARYDELALRHPEAFAAPRSRLPAACRRRPTSLGDLLTGCGAGLAGLTDRVAAIGRRTFLGS